jgi:hypothetical protein
VYSLSIHAVTVTDEDALPVADERLESFARTIFTRQKKYRSVVLQKPKPFRVLLPLPDCFVGMIEDARIKGKL